MSTSELDSEAAAFLPMAHSLLAPFDEGGRAG